MSFDATTMRRSSFFALGNPFEFKIPKIHAFNALGQAVQACTHALSDPKVNLRTLKRLALFVPTAIFTLMTLTGCFSVGGISSGEDLKTVLASTRVPQPQPIKTAEPASTPNLMCLVNQLPAKNDPTAFESFLRTRIIPYVEKGLGKPLAPVTVTAVQSGANPCTAGSLVGSACSSVDPSGNRSVTFYTPELNKLEPINQAESAIEEMIHSQAASRSVNFLTKPKIVRVENNGMKFGLYEGDVLKATPLFKINEIVTNYLLLQMTPEGCGVSYDKAGYIGFAQEMDSMVRQLGFSSLKDFSKYMTGNGGKNQKGDSIDLAVTIGSWLAGKNPIEVTGSNSATTFDYFTDGINALITMENIITSYGDLAQNYKDWNEIVKKINVNRPKQSLYFNQTRQTKISSFLDQASYSAVQFITYTERRNVKRARQSSKTAQSLFKKAWQLMA